MNKQTNKKWAKEVKDILQMKKHKQLISSWQNTQDCKLTGKCFYFYTQVKTEVPVRVWSNENSHTLLVGLENTQGTFL